MQDQKTKYYKRDPYYHIDLSQLYTKMKLVAYFLNKIYNFPDKGFGSLIKCKFTSFTGGFALVHCLHL